MMVFSTLLGACIGSFLNVCLHRWRSGGSVFFPSSYCPSCRKPIRWFDNVPILSFFWLKAKCRDCKTPISWQYPIVETLTALLFMGSFIFSKNDNFLMAKSFFFVSFLVLLLVCDLKWKLLPHPFNNFFILFGVASRWNFSLFSSEDFFRAACNFVFIGSALYGATQIIPKGLGGGDIKMAAALAVWLGLSKSFYVLIIAFGTGLLVVLSLFLLKKGRITKKTMIPFGPFLATSSLFAWFCPEFFNTLGVEL